VPFWKRISLRKFKIVSQNRTRLAPKDGRTTWVVLYIACISTCNRYSVVMCGVGESLKQCMYNAENIWRVRSFMKRLAFFSSLPIQSVIILLYCYLFGQQRPALMEFAFSGSLPFQLIMFEIVTVLFGYLANKLSLSLSLSVCVSVSA